jgi:2-methylisocitrate lyase-like PEP mutase family enzyme
MARKDIDTLKEMMAAKRGVLLPGAPNALAARVVANLGFEAIYLTGAGLTNMHLGLPDLGLVDLSQLVDHTMAIRGVVDLPIIVDADTGFGNALNVVHTVTMLERAGASAIQLEDQRAPKRCGHFAGKEVIPLDEAVGKIKAAVDARREGLLIIARTDACATDGFEAAIERAECFIEAGADMTFVEAPETLAQIERIPKALAAPQLLNMVIGGATPLLQREQAEQMGFSLVLYANAALQGAILGMQKALGALKAAGRLDEDSGLTATFAERQRLVGKPTFDAMEQRYASHR